MQKTGQIDLPLHTGKAPRWLFERMVRLSRCVSEVILIEFGRDYFLKQLSDSYWFQCLGCALGFDWHSSGLTTTVCGALKQAFKDLSDSGIYFCGGKGKTSRKTPLEIETISQRLGVDPAKLIYASKITAKVDNNALQDGFSLYQHSFIFTENHNWTVIQQGMSDDKQGWARRYHWYSERTNSFVDEPHQAVTSDKNFLTVNLIDKDISATRELIGELSGRKPEDNLTEINSLVRDSNKLPRRHQVLLKDLNTRFLDKIFLKTYEQKPENFESLLSMPGVGAKTLRALALVSELIYAKPLSFRDPARFSFAHGGKDGYPYRIQKSDYDQSINILEKMINKAKIERTDKIKALRRLNSFYSH